MRWPFQLCVEREIKVYLHVELGFHAGRLADLVQLLARSHAIIADLEPDRALYHVGLPERYTDVTFVVKTEKHKAEVLRELSESGFTVQEMSSRFQ